MVFAVGNNLEEANASVGNIGIVSTNCGALVSEVLYKGDEIAG